MNSCKHRITCETASSRTSSDNITSLPNNEVDHCLKLSESCNRQSGANLET